VRTFVRGQGCTTIGAGGTVAKDSVATVASLRPPMRSVFLGLLLGAVLAVFILASSAQAATTYAPNGEIFATPGSGPGELANDSGQIVVEDASGDILVTSGNQAPINVYEPSGNSAVYLGVVGAGELVNTYGLAIDQASGALYVSDPGSGLIAKYLSNGASPPVFTRDPTFTSPAAGSGAGQIGSFESPLAVDPTNGDLLVADRGNEIVSRYGPDGTFISSFDGTGSGAGRFVGLSSIAADAAGGVYVVDIRQEPIGFPGGASVVERFASDGTPDTSFAPQIQTPRTVGYDTRTGNVVVAGRSDGAFAETPFPVRLYVLNGGSSVGEVDFAAGNAGTVVTGLAFAQTGNHRLYAAGQAFLGGFGQNGIQVFDAVLLPDLTIAQASAVTQSSAHVAGTVNPGGNPTTYHFEYSREGLPALSTPEESAGSGESAISVEADLTGLTANSQYTVRLVATTTSGTFKSGPVSFHTSTSAPSVQTGAASDLTASGATLRGTINPFGLQTTFYFEYGTSSAYGARAPATGEGEVAGGGREVLNLARGIAGLAPGTVYHYRLVAVNSVGRSNGEDHTFTTKSAGESTRAFELVSPVEKGGANIEAGRGFQASPDGTNLAFWSKSPLGGGDVTTASAPLFPRYLATRSAAGWASSAVDPPELAPNQPASKIAYTLGISEDGTEALVVSLKALAEGAVENASNLYLRNTATGAYTTIVSVPGSRFWALSTTLGFSPFVGGTSNFSHLLIQAYYFGEALVPGTPASALFDWTGGELKLVSRAADETPLSAFPIGGGPSTQVQHEAVYISEDGSRIVFSAEGKVMVRADESTVAEIPGEYAGASRDLHYVFIYGSQLISNSEPGVESIYRYDVDSEEIELLSTVGNLAETSWMQTSADGSTIYFNSPLALEPGAVAGESNIYVWRDGALKLVASLDASVQDIRPREWMASPDGRYLAFGAHTQLTSYDNRTTACAHLNATDVSNPFACEMVYRFDADASAEPLTCASCRPDGAAPTGNAHLGLPEPEVQFGGHHFPRSMLDDGEVLFDTPDPLSLADTNSVRDVYSFNGTEQTLISSGIGSNGSEFADATPDGSNVYFTTADRLVGQDTDDLVDVYDARKGGGIASQNPPAPQVPCSGEACRGPSSSAPVEAPGGSETLVGPGNARPGRGQACAKSKHAQKSKGKTRCVANKKPKKHKSKKTKKSGKAKSSRADSDRRTGR
jgi:hypothetical protein